MAISPEVTAAVGGLLPPLLRTLTRIEWVQRRLDPPLALRLAEALAEEAAALPAPLAAACAVEWPQDWAFMRDRLVEVSDRCGELAAQFAQAARDGGEPIGLYRALRRFAPIQEALYPLAPALEAVSRWFLEPARRSDDALVARLRDAALREGPVRSGVFHASNGREERGGFSLYVPEAWDAALPAPLVVALHGGHGHGRDFLWAWLREARSRQVLLAAPTSRGRTWSIMGGEDVDAEPIGEMVESIAARYAVDRTRVLLTGMSDGGTYALLCGLREASPFTHLAPACGALHPGLLAGGGLGRARGRPVYLVHGALDWMFPVYTAQFSRKALEAAGARLVYREIADLSHTYPREENAAILDWLSATA